MLDNKNANENPDVSLPDESRAVEGEKPAKDDADVDATIKALSEGKVSKEQEEMLAKLDKESATAKIQSSILSKVFYLLCIGVTLYHLYVVVRFPPPTLINRSLHVGMILIICFFMYPRSKKADRKGKGLPWYDWILIAGAIAVPVYMAVEFAGVIHRSGLPNTADTVIATILVLLTLEGARRAGGWPLPIICISFLAYGLWGGNLPGMFWHRGNTWSRIVNHLFSNTEGIFGTSVAVAASFIFMFILFGAIMNKSGMGKFFTDISMALAGHTKGGPAKVVVISSALLGSINGSAIANVVTTGPFTIPLMKKVGYNKVFAGAVEASASAGGQILPPVMGAAAFIMAEMLGIPYSSIIIFAAIPAMLYFVGVMAQVQLRASKENLVGVERDKLPRVKDVMKERGHLLIPIFVLLYFLMFTPITVSLAAVYTIVATLIIAQLRKTTRMSIKDIFDAFADGAKQTAPVAAACAAVGIVVGVISLTGFGMSMVNAIIQIGGQNLILTLIFTMITCLILGLGVPSIPAYIITASIAAPALYQLGIPLISAHLFVFYFAMFANITPPAGLVSMAASGISGANPMSTGVQALRLALAGFIVPFMFVFSTDLLLIDVTFFRGVQVAVMAVLGVILLSVAVEGFMFTRVHFLVRAVALVGALLLIAPETISDIVGFALFLLVAGYQYTKKRRMPAAPLGA